MKFKSYINEDKQTFELIWENIKKDCSEFVNFLIKIKSHHLLWRGTKKQIKDYKKIKPRKDRYPKDIPEELHFLLDDLFKKYYSWPARSEGVFATIDHMSTLYYGKPYMFFPSNGFKFLWSNDISDLWADILAGNYDYEETGVEIDEWHYKFGEGEQGNWSYNGILLASNDLEDAKEEISKTKGISPNKLDDEDFIWVPEVTYEDWYEEKMREWTAERNEWFERTVKNYSNKNLRKAMKSGNEIMFKCKFYYLVSQKYNGSILEKIL